MDELPDDEEYSRVVPIRAGTRARTASVGRAQPEAWTPREVSVPTAAREPLPTPALEPRMTRTHRWMIAAFAIVCIGMIGGMVLLRIFDEVSRTVAALPSDATATRVDAPVTTAPSVPAGVPPAATGPAGTPVVSTEIHVLQPNYTVAPGDTLGSIARKNGTTVDALASINNLENRNSLSIGQKLIIP